MKCSAVTFENEFLVLAGDQHSQAAEMVIAPGGKEGGPDNRHPNSDQWLYVRSGIGEALIEGERVPLKENVLLLIQRGDAHEIRNTGTTALETLTLYVPPLYDATGDPLPGQS